LDLVGSDCDRSCTYDVGAAAAVVAAFAGCAASPGCGNMLHLLPQFALRHIHDGQQARQGQQWQASRRGAVLLVA
jgi:hypothetical protein